jgi:hypothetical protein
MAKTTSTPSASVRPWQGTLLGVLNAIGVGLLALLTLGVLLLSIMGSTILSQMTTSGVQIPSFITGVVGFILLVPMIGFLVLGIFITLGFFKGAQWAVIVSIVFTVLGLLSALGSIRMSIVPLVIDALILWAEIICYKHPFYNKK